MDSSRHWSRVAVFALAVVLAIFGAWACREHVDEDAMPAGRHRGQTLFANHCAACHGLDGRGQALPVHDEIPVLASDLSSAEVQGRYSDLQLANVIRAGIGSVMPAFGDVLTNSQIEDVTAQVRSLAPGSSSHLEGQAE